ncbi:MAG: hypothetical protein ACTSW2_06320 [Alphaproteobacteria bacterium]
MMRIAKLAMQAVVFSGFFVAAGGQAATTTPNTPPLAFKSTHEVNLGDYLQGDYIRADFFHGTYLRAGFIKVAETRVAQVARKQTTVMRKQTAALPMGTIRLRVIPQIGGATVDEAISWRVTTFGRDSSGTRPTVTQVTGSTPELVLPAGWYVVHAQMADSTIKHPVEVTAGRTFKYTLVKN